MLQDRPFCQTCPSNDHFARCSGCFLQVKILIYSLVQVLGEDPVLSQDDSQFYRCLFKASSQVEAIRRKEAQSSLPRLQLEQVNLVLYHAHLP